MSLGEYYKGFIGILGGLTIIVDLIPLFAFFGFEQTKFTLPPLGESKAYYTIGAVIIALLVTVPVYFCRNWGFLRGERGKGVFAFLFFIFFVGIFILYIVLIEKYVVVIEFDNKPVYLTKGCTRTVDPEGKYTDVELIKSHGLRDSDLEKVWTPNSILIVRLSMFITYLLIITTVVAGFSFLVLYNLSSGEG